MALWPEDLHLLRPLWLLMVPLILALWWRWRQVGEELDWRSSIDAHLRGEMLVRHRARALLKISPRRRVDVVALAALLAICLMSGPVWDRIDTAAVERRQARIILLDASSSMLAEDQPPSRFERARFLIRDLLISGEDWSNALVVFARAAYMVSPLTEDRDTLLVQLNNVSPQIMPVQGSSIGSALQVATQMITDDALAAVQIVLLSDSSPRPADLQRARELAAQGHHLQVVALGSAAGAPVPLGSGLLRDSRDQVIVAETDISGLRELAVAGGGQLLRPSHNIGALNRRVSLAATNESATIAPERITIWHERLVVMLPLVALLTLGLFVRSREVD